MMFFDRLAAAAAAGPDPAAPQRKRTRSASALQTPSTAAPAVALTDRGVSLGFLSEAFGLRSGNEPLTPGQLVHGRNTGGPPDDWRCWDPEADPRSIRALTERSGLSLVETALQLAGRDPLLCCDGAGRPWFGPATDFVSYTWHGMNCGQLLAALDSDAGCPGSGPGSPGRAGGPTRGGGEQQEQPGGRFYWLDICAVAQNNTPPQDLEFEAVIAAVPRAVVVMSPWSNPRMLSRCWCLHELGIIFAAGIEVRVAHLPAEVGSFRGAIKANFGSLLMTLCARVDSESAHATRKEDKDRIFAEIRGSIGFEELDIRVLTLLNSWLRAQHSASAGGEWEQRPAREQVVDFRSTFDVTVPCD